MKVVQKGENREKNRRFARFESSKDYSKLKELYLDVKQKYNLEFSEIIGLFEKKEILIPVTIFNDKLSGLEVVVKYLKENAGLDNLQIAELLNRSSKTVWQAYNVGKRKFKGELHIKPTQFFLPVSIFSDRKLSVLENIVVYLKDKYDLKYSVIARLLHRDQRTIWTVYKRGKDK